MAIRQVVCKLAEAMRLLKHITSLNKFLFEAMLTTIKQLLITLLIYYLVTMILFLCLNS